MRCVSFVILIVDAKSMILTIRSVFIVDPSEEIQIVAEYEGGSGSDRAVDAIPASDRGGTGAQTSGMLQMLLGCDKCSHGDCIQSLAGMPWRCF